MIEDGLYSLMEANIPDFLGVDGSGKSAYKMYYLASLDPVATPYCVFRRYKRATEIDLTSKSRQLISNYVISIDHDDSWVLLDIQNRIRALLESLPLTTLGGIYIQSLEILDDYHDIPPLIQEARSRVFTGVLDFEITHNPN